MFTKLTIETEADYKAALIELKALFQAEDGTPPGDRLEFLANLVEAYENKHYPIDLPDPINYLYYFMESRGLTEHDLVPYIGSLAKVSEILHRHRVLTLPMICRLHQGLGIPAEILIQPIRKVATPQMAMAA